MKFIVASTFTESLAGGKPFLHPDAQRRFRVIDNEDNLRQSLEIRWARRSLVPAIGGVRRGACLFNSLAAAANSGKAIGISYGGFIAYLHGVSGFRDVTGRNYLPSDSGPVIQIAVSVTSEAGGRKEVARSGCLIHAGMDTFIWNQRRPFDRPNRAWLNPKFFIPYTPDEWRLVFPDSARRLITAEELQDIAAQV